MKLMKEVLSDPELAPEIFQELVEWVMTGEKKPNYQAACEIVKSNIGYLSANFSQKDRKLLEQYFNCIHPILGSVDRNLSPEDVFFYGAAVGKMASLGKEKFNFFQQPPGDPY